MKKYEALITNGTGRSIKSWFIHRVTIAGLVLLSIVGVVLLVDVIWDGKIDSAVSDLAGLVGAISTLFVSVGLPKMVGEIVEKRKGKTDDKAGTNSISE